MTVRAAGSRVGSRGSRRRLSLPVAVVAAVLAAEGAVWLLRPDESIEPVAVSESQFFSAAQLERARDYAGGQRLLGLGALALQGTVLIVAVVRPPRRVIGLAERLVRRRAVAAGALVGAGLATTVALAPLPLRAIARERALDIGLATQGWAGWTLDVLKETALGAALAAAGAALFLALMRRFPRRWWVSAVVATLGIEVLFVWLGPVVLAPMFNRFEHLPPGRTRADVVALARGAGVDVGDVFVVDASRRTRGANAFVTGLGHTKRVVLYDTLIDRFSPAQVRLVVAHELGHVDHRDLWRGMLWVALAAPGGMYLVKRLTERWAPRAGAVPGAPGSLPALALALALVTFGGTVVSSQLSRAVEARADAFAFELTGEPRQFVAMERRLTLVNIADPSPPRALRWLFGTHPSPIERIGAALAYEERKPRDMRRPP